MGFGVDCHRCLNCNDLFDSLQEYVCHKKTQYDCHQCLMCSKVISGLDSYMTHKQYNCQIVKGTVRPDDVGQQSVSTKYMSMKVKLQA